MAEKFERWEFEEVLPSIRKTGGDPIPAMPRQPMNSDLPAADALTPSTQNFENQMNPVIPFHFSGSEVRVFTVDGEPWFNAGDVCAVLEFGNPRQAIESHVDDDDVQKLDAIDNLGRKQRANHVNEAGLYALVLGSTKETAKRFKRWVTHEVLPAIRKTGGYTTPTARRQPTKIEVELAGAEAFVRMLKPAPSSQVSMLTHIIKANGGAPGFLPSYVTNAAPDSASGSSMETKPLTELLKMHGINLRACAYNRQLEDAGFLSRNTRRSTSAAGGMKPYWTVTKAGLRYGKNVTNPGNPRETQPHWYVERFTQMHRTVAAGGPYHDALPMPMEIAA